MKYSQYTLQELRHLYLTTKNPLEKDIIAVYGKHSRKEKELQAKTIKELRRLYLASKDENEKKLIEWIGKRKKHATT